jgi:hypothetical protein
MYVYSIFNGHAASERADSHRRTHAHTHARTHTHTHTEEYIHVPAINGECKAYFFDFFLVRNHVGDLLL